jgi:hypothetical protein
MKFWILLLMLTFTFVACGGGNSTADVIEDIAGDSNIQPEDIVSDGDVLSPDTSMPFCVLGQSVLGACKLGQ